MELGNRKFAFKSLVGSHNYNLNIETSDKDYKVFVFPTFDDLYFNKSYSKSCIGETEDYDIHDIRKCNSLFYKANVNFLEVLFSNDIILNYNLDSKSIELIEELLNIKDDIAKMNLKYLYNACIGMHLNKMKYITKGTEGTQYLVDLYGYDTKQCLHAYRILDFLVRYADNNFTDFKQAITYNKTEREFLLDIKNGKYDLERAKEIVSTTFKYVEENYKDIYLTKEFNEETNGRLLSIIKELVRLNLEV